MPRTSFNSIVAVTLCVTVAAVLAAGQAPQDEATEPDALKNLQDRIEALEAERQTLDFNVSSLSQLSPPIGSVIAFAGEWPPSKPDGTKWTELELGWMLCDGRQLEGLQYEVVRLHLGESDRLPDYQGYFLRGLGREGGLDAGRTVGSLQDWATGMPRLQFKTDEQGEHTHGLRNRTGHDAGSGTPDHIVARGEDRHVHQEKETGDTFPAGKHSHAVVGGDPETRPANVAVHWIIKVSAPRLE